MATLGFALQVLLLGFLLKLVPPHREVPVPHMLSDQTCFLLSLIGHCRLECFKHVFEAESKDQGGSG